MNALFTCLILALGAEPLPGATAGSPSGARLDEPTVALGDWRSEPRPEAALPPSVGQPLAPVELAALATGEPVTPFVPLTCGLKLADGTLWVGSDRGLMLRQPVAARWRLFHSRRCLPDDRVEALSVAADGSIWVRTPAGLGRLVRQNWTLPEKIDHVHAMLRRHHLRLGMVTEIELKTPGTLAGGTTQHTNDNDGLWTSLYVAAEAFRYGATGDPEARRNAWESLRAMLFLEEVTGIPGFAARSVVPGSEPDPAPTYGGQWHRSADGRWWWKGDTSSDELVGHYFAWCVYYDVAATDEQKEPIRRVVARVTDHILDHGYYYVGPDGKPTTWGFWGPEELNGNLRRIEERGLNSLEILSFLKVAEHVTGNARYAQAARELVDRHGYAMNTVLQKIDFPPEAVNHSDDELAFLSYYPLLWLERDPRLRAFYLASLERSWRVERPEHSPLFNLIYAACRQADRWSEPSRRPEAGLLEGIDYDREACLEWFRDVPADTIAFSIDNRGRRDLPTGVQNRFGAPAGAEVLPISERLLLRWNADPYALRGGEDGRVRGDGAFILLPYWLGRYHRLIS